MKNNIIYGSDFPNGRWIVTVGKDILTSETSWKDSLEFVRTHDLSPEALKNAKRIDWSSNIFNIVHNKENGELLFTDRGNRVTFDREIVTDDDIRLALVHAQQKFGKELTLTGDDPRFKERMARLADDMGLTVLNPELQAGLEKYKSVKFSAMK